MLKNCAKKSHLFQTRIASQTQNIFGLVSINLQLSKLKTISTFQNTVHNRVPIPLGFLIQFRHMDANHRQRPHSTTTRTFAQRNWFTRTQAFLSSGLMNKVFCRKALAQQGDPVQGVPTSLEWVKSNILILRSLRAKQAIFRKNRILLQKIAILALFVNCKIENGIFKQLCSSCLM